MEYGIYQCKDEDATTVYIGSSKLTLEQLEKNHRNYYQYSKGYESQFRKNLREKGKNWTFEWVLKPMKCTVKGIETVEGAFIRFSKPKYNKDQYPVNSSIKYGRYN
ncbi:hypothetical protein PQZ39_01085 [bacterium]|nr:hypothetical protein [bacterium]